MNQDNNNNLLAIDVGQSGSRYWYGGKKYEINRGMYAGEPIHEALQAILSVLNLRSNTVALSLTGLYGDVGDVSRFYEVCSRFSGATEVAVIDDGLANLAGSLQGAPGVALVLGSGIVAVGGNGNSLSHSDGLSSHFGDEGGGFWLGSRGLTRALATRDERDSEFELMKFFAEEISEYDNLKSKNGPEASLLAIQSAATLLIAADTGIPIAKTIRAEGARLLAKTVVSAWLKVGKTGEEFKVAISGGLSRNTNYTFEIVSEINKLEKCATQISPKGDNIDGAIWIAKHWKEDIRPMLGWARA